jgi:hypothetical protein
MNHNEKSGSNGVISKKPAKAPAKGYIAIIEVRMPVFATSIEEARRAATRYAHLIRGEVESIKQEKEKTTG